MSNEMRLDKETQIGRVYAALKEGSWLTLLELNQITGDPVSSISAQCRHLRKRQYGGFTILKRRRGPSECGIFEYLLVEPAQGEI